MKCACGYECEWHYEKYSIKKIYSKGDEEFITVLGTFFIYAEPYSSDKKEITIYMCPKCGALQGNKYG